MEYAIAILGGLFAGGALLALFAVLNAREKRAADPGRAPMILNVFVLPIPFAKSDWPASRRDIFG